MTHTHTHTHTHTAAYTKGYRALLSASYKLNARTAVLLIQITQELIDNNPYKTAAAQAQYICGIEDCYSENYANEQFEQEHPVAIETTVTPVETGMTLQEALDASNNIYKNANGGTYTVVKANLSDGYYKDFKHSNSENRSPVNSSTYYSASEIQSIAYFTGNDGWHIAAATAATATTTTTSTSTVMPLNSLHRLIGKLTGSSDSDIRYIANNMRSIWHRSDDNTVRNDIISYLEDIVNKQTDNVYNEDERVIAAANKVLGIILGK